MTGAGAGLVLVALCAGCPATPRSPDPGSVPIAAVESPPPDAPEVSDDERLAMIGHAMTRLAPAASQCWAAGAVDDYLLKGTVTLLIAPRAEATRVDVEHDTTDDAVLVACLRVVAAAYPWPAALSGELIQLPFAFEAPDGQFTIDRRLVPINGQRGVGVAVILDDKNSGNPAATLLELTFRPGAALAMARAERHEVWYVVTGAATVAGTALAPGDVVDVPAGTYRAITAGDAGMTAAVVVVPGGIEGVARGGALPGTTVYGTLPARAPAPRVIPRATATTYRADRRVVELYLDSTARGAAKELAVAVLSLEAGAVVPEHVHAGETELLYVIAGAADMVIDGVALPVTGHLAVQIPAGKPHRATVTAPLRALQLYTPGGPEKRWKP